MSSSYTERYEEGLLTVHSCFTTMYQTVAYDRPNVLALSLIDLLFIPLLLVP